MPKQTMEEEQAILQDAPWGVDRDDEGILRRCCPDKHMCYEGCVGKICFLTNDRKNRYLYMKQINNIVHTVYGDCYGICISKREDNDDHLCWTILVEDDANWFVSERGGSSFWLIDLQNVIEETITWLDNNAVKNRWGWSLSNIG